MIEHSPAAAEEYGYKVDLNLVQQSGTQALLDEIGTACYRNVENLGILARLAAGHAVTLAPAGQTVDPLVQPFAALPQGLLDAVIWAGNESIQ
jgi:hypothetical protein